MNKSVKLKDVPAQVSSPLLQDFQRRNATGLRAQAQPAARSPIRFRATAKTWTDVQHKQQSKKSKPTQMPRTSKPNAKGQNSNAFVFKDFIPPGAHYFYFVKDGQFFCLSSQFLVETYPGTNLRMNTVLVEERDWNIDFTLEEKPVQK